MPTIHTPAPGDPLAPPPPATSRRSVLAWLAATVPATTSFRYAIPWLRRLERLDDALLVALATSILPSDLGPDGARRIADALQKWIAGYRAGAELNHGYGSARIRTTGADPSTRWALQLRSLEADARRVHSAGFAAITPDQRRALVRTQLVAERAAAIPGDTASAAHVALALLAVFYGSPEATDFCYEASITPTACRPLGAVTQPPVPLRRNGGRS
jgi:hypothetical protein